MKFKIFTGKKYNILILGSNGMLGSCLMDNFTKCSVDRDSPINVVHGLDFPVINLGNRHALAEYLSKSIHYDYIINCAAITNTVGIEGELKDQSYLINALAVKWIAQACNQYDSNLIHVSTDYVFSENTLTTNDNGEYELQHCHDPLADEYPINEYGMHKLIGELFIKNEMDKMHYLIMRVSWLYGKHGNKSFIHKFLKNCLTKVKEAKLQD